MVNKGYKDVTGQRFGKLIAVERLNKKKRSTYFWKCRCDCGNFCEVPLNYLTQGNTSSCGCLRTPDFKGKVIGRLTVLNIHSKGKSILWSCQCSCGNMTTATTAELKIQKKKSCGCLEAENKKAIAGHNFLDLTNLKFGKLLVLKRSDKNKEKGLAFWDCICDCGENTVVESSHLTNGHTKSCGCLLDLAREQFKTIAMEPEIIEKRKKTFKENDGIENGTRLCALAKTEPPKTNTSGYPGVSYAKRERKWRAYITLKGKQQSLGYYNTKEEAIEARQKGEELYHIPILNKYTKK
ncbi:AP2 domain-containing protein [Enterococcus sp. CWB-B31]|uniref:AP2 domain-containing protein n=1 Tax=Enterococcus sp. CWB-B31 TaxID=2885159 RepID=UPI001E4FDB1D|nr:AP2/ERF family transcription factor [Enterococcus sp. CWB-B31]MCB5953975.1 AP2 domain-containing protein [Enterococcus sp. CWB-B31]